MKYPNRIKELRELHKLRQEDIYLKLGWVAEDKGQSRFSKLENGQRKLQFKVAKEIARIIGVTAEEVAGEKSAISLLPQSNLADTITNLLLEAAVGSKASELVSKEVKRFINTAVDDDLRHDVEINIDHYKRIIKQSGKA